MIWNDEMYMTHGFALLGEGFSADRVNPASVDLRIGNQFIDLHTGNPFTAETLCLNPGDAILAETIERVCIPVEVAAAIYLKSSMARKGLDHALAGWIDCGFIGSITLELHAHRPVVLNAGQRVIQMVVWQMIAPPLKPYQGRYQGQSGPTLAREEKQL